VKNRGNGLGSDIMSKILDVSDRLGIKVKLVPVDYDEDENSPKNYLQKLKNWYSEGFGFKKSIFSFDPYYTYTPVQETYKMVG
jgi:cytochrome oxidase Cu insertion factor (SCO1/SenC/PrrC family)